MGNLYWCGKRILIVVNDASFYVVYKSNFQLWPKGTNPSWRTTNHYFVFISFDWVIYCNGVLWPFSKVLECIFVKRFLPHKFLDMVCQASLICIRGWYNPSKMMNVLADNCASLTDYCVNLFASNKMLKNYFMNICYVVSFVVIGHCLWSIHMEINLKTIV